MVEQNLGEGRARVAGSLDPSVVWLQMPQLHLPVYSIQILSDWPSLSQCILLLDQSALANLEWEGRKVLSQKLS